MSPAVYFVTGLLEKEGYTRGLHSRLAAPFLGRARAEQREGRGGAGDSGGSRRGLEPGLGFGTQV